MKYPSFNQPVLRQVSVPQLSGGINLRDSLSTVADNQLTSCLNVWQQGGVLKTRPSFKENLRYIELLSGESTVKASKVFPNIKDSEGKALNSCQRSMPIGDNLYQVRTHLWWQGEKTLLPSIEGLEHTSRSCDFFAVIDKEYLYCFFENRNIFRLSLKGNAWELIRESDFYIPTVIVNATYAPSLRGGSQLQKLLQSGGTLFEGYNLLSPYYKIIYTSVNRNVLNDETTSHEMRYGLPFDCHAGGRAGRKIKAKLTKPNGWILSYEVTITDEGKDFDVDLALQTENGHYKKTADGKYYFENDIADYGNGPWLAVENDVIFFLHTVQDENGNFFVQRMTVTESDYLESNLEVTAPSGNSEENLDKVFKMTENAWFGGAAGPKFNGSRLFLCGNSKESEKSLVIWSGLNNPLYFPENNYMYVGNTAEAVTGFGKQSDKLVIFKSHETYYTQYVQNSEITADELINQSVIDYEASSVYFPLTLLNGEIGCDLPSTVALCRNRLVWAHSSGKVYTLTTESQYNEHNIYDISEMVASLLRTADFSNASAVDFMGHYVLCAGRKLYLMDYNSYGYQYVYSYSKAEDANIKIPWYIWDFDDMISGLESDVETVYPLFFENQNSLIISVFCDISSFMNRRVNNIEWMLSDENEDGIDRRAFYENFGISFEALPINNSFRTKFFDFSAANRRKSVHSVGLALANTGNPLNISFITDFSTEQEVIFSGESKPPRSPEYLTSRILYPTARNILRFGMEISAEGLMAIEGINLSFRFTGGAR